MLAAIASPISDISGVLTSRIRQTSRRPTRAQLSRLSAQEFTDFADWSTKISSPGSRTVAQGSGDDLWKVPLLERKAVVGHPQ